MCAESLHVPAADAGDLEPGLQADQKLIDRGWLRMGIGLAVAGQSMVFSLAVNITPADGAGYWVVHGLLAFAAFAVLGLLGGDLVGSAWQALRARRISIDLLFLVTLLGALVGSLVSTITGTGSVYYEVVAVLIVVHTAGKMLGARSRMAALKAVADTRETFDKARVRLPDGGWEWRPVKSLAPADRVWVPAGAAIPVDGVIVAGRGYVQETTLTGEWQPSTRASGDSVWAGTYSVDGDFEIAPTSGPRKLDAILQAVGEAQMAPSRWQKQADRLTAWFLPLVITVSAATFAGWLWAGPWERALFNAMAVLLVACPCAMGLATPIAVWGGLARLAGRGLVARSGDFLETLSRVDTVCIDKTGTLSGDRLRVTGWQIEPGFDADWLKAAVRAVEERSEHPVARALAEGIFSGERPIVSAVDVEPGRGIAATVATSDGRAVRIRIGEPADGQTRAAVAEKTVYVTCDGAHAARVTLGEQWREGMREGLAGLQSLGLSVEVLTGDPHPPSDLGVPVTAGMAPEQKLKRIRELDEAGHVILVVGDGLNDAAALGAADAAVAMRGGSGLARAAAMAVCAGDDLRVLPEAVMIARQVKRGVSGNLIFASAYNITGMGLAAAGVLHPVVAALLMLGSSLAVAIRALRSSRVG